MSSDAVWRAVAEEDLARWIRFEAPPARLAARMIALATMMNLLLITTPKNFDAAASVYAAN
jgi:hypothetical protein